MIVLMWIYVFQFEDILDKWQNATGMTDSQYVTILLLLCSLTYLFCIHMMVMLCCHPTLSFLKLFLHISQNL